MSNPYESPGTSETPPPQVGVSLGSWLVRGLIVVALIGIVVALLLPSVRMAREPARRSECANNLKHIALALHMYHDEHKSLPPAYTVDEEGRPLHSWRTLILPHLEQKALYDKIDLTRPWDDPVNREAYESMVGTYQCPSNRLENGQTTYLAVVAPNGCFGGSAPRRLDDITDGSSQTLMVVEVDASRSVHWMSPHDATAQVIHAVNAAKDLPHHGGFQAAMADGSVRYFRAPLDAKTLEALISVAGDDDPTAGFE
jgi:type II secretory pathway pseudopilin PulG